MMKKIHWGPSWTDNYGRASLGCIRLRYSAQSNGWRASASIWDVNTKERVLVRYGKIVHSTREAREDAVRLARELISKIADEMKHFK